MNLVEYTEYLVKSICKEPDMVKVSSFGGEDDAVILEIIVPENDMGAVIGKNGKVTGIISANKIVVNGVFEGNVDADSVEILSGGFVLGDVCSGSFSIENGGRFDGKSSLKKSNSMQSLENFEIIDTEESGASKDI